MKRLLTALLITSCGDEPPKNTSIEINKPVEVVTQQGEQGEQGEKGEQGVAGQDMKITEVITCTDDVPNYSGYKFTYQVSIFSSGDTYATAVIHDDEYTIASSSSWTAAFQEKEFDDVIGKVVLYRDKQLNDDWASYIFEYQMDGNYRVRYIDPVDGDEEYLVPNKCTIDDEG